MNYRFYNPFYGYSPNRYLRKIPQLVHFSPLLLVKPNSFRKFAG